MRLALLITLAAISLSAQTWNSTVRVSWKDTVNPAGTTYNIYRAPGSCAGTPAFAKLNQSPVTEKTYEDNVPTPGVYCYMARAFSGGLESVNSNTDSSENAPAEPTEFKVEVVVVVRVAKQ